MRRSPAFLVVGLLAACGGKVEATGDDATGDSGADAPAQGPLLVAVAPTGNDGGSDAPLTPIAGATVCISNHPELPCAQTAADGTYSLPLPFFPVPAGGAIQNAAFTTSAPGFQTSTYLVGFTPLDTLAGPNPIELSPTSAAEARAVASGFAYPAPETAFVDVDLVDVTSPSASFAGAQLVLTAADGQVLSPVYVDRLTLTPEPSLTSCPGTCMATFAAVPPGRFTVTATGTGRSCSAMPDDIVLEGSWTSDDSDASGGLAVAGSWLSSMTLGCKTRT